MAEQFRTTVSIVFWSADATDAQALVDSLTSAVPEEDRSAVLSTIEFVAAGKPEPAPEVPVNGG